jgi:preprotein translocase subunit YajC
LTVLHFLSQVLPASQPAATQPSSSPPGWFESLNSPMFPILLGIVVLYYFMSRSKKSDEKSRTKMLKEMKKGDRVQTIGGILGTVVEVRETDVVLKVDETSNTKIKFTRSAIHHVVEEETK